MTPMDIVPLVRKLLRSRVLRVLFFGGTGFLLQTALFEVLAFYLGVLSPAWATVAGGEAGLLLSFFLNNAFSFNDRVDTHSFATRLWRYHMVVSFSLLIQWSFLFTAEHLTTNVLVLHIVYVAGVIVGFASNYFGYSRLVWK